MQSSGIFQIFGHLFVMYLYELDRVLVRAPIQLMVYCCLTDIFTIPNLTHFIPVCNFPFTHGKHQDLLSHL